MDATGVREDAITNEVDYAIPYEGEIALGQLIGALAGKGEDPRDGRQLIFRDESGLVIRPNLARIQNLDEIPKPDRSDVPYHLYWTTGSDEPGAFALQHSSRGCRYRCKC